MGASPASGGTLPAIIGGDAGATNTLTGTAEHPFWSVTRGAWVEMGALQSRETLLLAGGQTATVTSVRTERLATPLAVYNFEVADWHTYHVGTPTGWVWVHNTCTPKQFERWLNKGPANNSVYLGTKGSKPVYAGITNNVTRRTTEHAKAFDVESLFSGLTRRQARSVEQALITANPAFKNVLNSIDPRRNIYDRALRWGQDYLRKNGRSDLLGE